MVLLKPLLFIVPDTTANQIRIMLLKATHTPFLGAIWLWEHWEAIALKREEEERAAMGLDLDVTDNNTASTASTNQPKPIKSKTSTSYSKKHSLTKTGKVKIPAALLAQASKRPSKKTGVSPDTNGRVKVTSTTLTAGTNGTAAAPPPPPAPPAPEPAPGAEAGAGQAAPALASGDIGEMMRMLKELSVQVEEVRAALVKHDQGPEVQ